MKKVIYVVSLLLSVYASHAQNPFMNEWIDYNKTYYKFKIGAFGTDAIGNPIPKGLVRLTQPSLAAIGLGSVPAEQFQLWHDGQENPIYVSIASGALSASDYIEFWGEIPNGKPDKYLYKSASYQLTDHTSLETDTASYFLTINPFGNNKRFANTANNTAGTILTPDRNFMYTASRIFRGFINNGFGVAAAESDGAFTYLYTSSYGSGEGLASRSIYDYSPIFHTFSNMYVDTLGNPMTLWVNMAGAAPNARNIKISLNSDSLTQFSMDYFSLTRLVMPGISPIKIKSNSAAFSIQNLKGNNDDCRIGKLELEYPRFFNFGAVSSFEFYIDSSSKGRYLKISNFNKGTAAAILYDFTNGKRYTANAGLGDTLEFLLKPSIEKYHLLLVRNDGSTAKTISGLEQKNFTDFSKTINQGDYLIITNPVLYGSGSSNYIQQYKDYRSSDSGGKFNAKIIDIHELEDQFAYGIKMNPLSIKNFLRYSRAVYQKPPSYVFLVGKGVTYTSFRNQEATRPLITQLNLIPVFGSPGSDNLLSSEDTDPVPLTPIGRLSAVTPEEVGVYLKKIKDYEAAQRDTSATAIASNLWKKKVLQLAGANDVLIEGVIDSFQMQYTQIISDTLFGADVHTFSKTTSTGSAYGASVLEFTNEYNTGCAMVEYLGHSSSTAIDFSLDNPANYSNTGKYPVFLVNGCLAGNIFDYDINRFNNRSTLSEKFVLEPDKGSIGYLSSSNYGVLNYLHVFTTEFYKAITSTEYGKGFGDIIQKGLKEGLDYTGNTDFYGLMHAEQLTFHGDPALKLNTYNAPDYAIDSIDVTASPSYLTVASDSLILNIKVRNLGKAISDSVHFLLARKYPNGTVDMVFNGLIAPVNSAQTLSFKLPIVANRDKGTTVFTAIIDDKDLVSELKEDNNIASLDVKISAADVFPVSPYKYSIINTDKVNLVASTSYAFDSLTQYVMELDTTSLFNSPIKLSMQTVSTGGIIEFDSVPLALDNVAYFWRVSEDSAEKHWNTFSLVHRSLGNQGFEQAHFLQHTESTFKNIAPDSTARNFNFGHAVSNIFILHSIYPTSGNEDNHFSIALNGSIITWSANVGSSIIFNVFDPKTLKPILNTTRPYSSGLNVKYLTQYNFEYSTQSAAARKNAVDFMDYYVQNGYYVVVRKIYDIGNTDWAPTVWAKDTATYGSGNSLYHRLKAQGVVVDSFTYPRTFMAIYKKNDSSTYKTITKYTLGLYDRISLSQNYIISDSTGSLTSPLFGPGKSWNKATWYGTNENGNNTTSLDIIGVDKNGADSVFYNIPTTQHVQDISNIDANTYPFVKLRMNTMDSLTIRPYQLTDWSVEFIPVPEGALATNLGSSIPSELVFDHDINVQFDTLKGYVIFKNISTTAMGPLKVKLIIYDPNNNPINFTMPLIRALPAGDTVHIPFLLNVTAFPEGKYNFYIDINPDNDQPEQYHYNNFLYKYIDIKRDFILALDGIDLTAKALNKTVELKWFVKNELNVASYDVQFSKDGSNFTSIGKVAPTNASASLKQYSFNHLSPVNGPNYYRIKMIDKDGSISYSSIRKAEIKFSNILVYPNPFGNYLNIVMSDLNPVKLRLIDLSGRQLLQQSFSGATTIHINNITKGVYLLQIIDGSTAHTFKVFKQ
jgi:hypothetical protein